MVVAASRLHTFTGWLLAAGLAGCPRGTTEAGSGGTAGDTNAGGGAVGSRAIAAHALASETAFDLTVSERGALLAWAEAAPSGALHISRFDLNGERAELAGSAALPTASGATDLALTESQNGVGVVWREPGEPGAARGAWLDPAGSSQRLELGAAWGAAQAGRGNLALAARGAGALALVRGPREACNSAPASTGGADSAGNTEEPCFGFRFYRLSASGVLPVGLGLHVPVPCDARAALLLAGPGSDEQRYHYAVCTREAGETVLTAFSIDPARSYAASQPVLPGCQPLGAGLFAGQPTFVAECRGSRRLARFVGADSPFALQSADVRGLLCGSGASGAPRVRFGDGWLALTGPQAQLELLLDAELSPPGSRAVWTGSALLVARAAGGQLALDRYRCAGTELQRQPVRLE
ncbi:MAG: hypothetical protein RL685_6056 [Pseudomonadota bacterium]|jgi:hypothetical protein